ncbi:MAG: methylamine utilization protein [Prolixibacteraceae bacterium]|nr:methylamine utilization protein [Burkholderiales bacterium]
MGFLGLAAAAACGVAAAAGVSGSVTDAGGAPVTEAVIYAVALGEKPASASRRGIMDQVNKEYFPLVVPVQVGAAVIFPNKDNIRHHVYSFSAAKPFELKLYSGTPAKPVVFDKPGPVVLGCNIHDWMVGYIYVVDTPYFAKTDTTGSARLEGLPAGEYQLRVWHPYMKGEPAALSLKLADSGIDNASFRLELSAPQRLSPAKP